MSDMSKEINVNEIVRMANYQAHEAAMEAIKDRPINNAHLYKTVYEEVFNSLFRKLLMPETGETPRWLVKLANYFTFDSEIDEIEEHTGRSEDPLNEAEYVSLTIRFKRNGSGPVTQVTKERIPLEPV